MKNNSHPLLGKTIGFCPDIDRGAQFIVKKITRDTTAQGKVKVVLRYTNGRWTPSTKKKNFTLSVPEDFNENHLAEAWIFQ